MRQAVLWINGHANEVCVTANSQIVGHHFNRGTDRLLMRLDSKA